MDTKDTRGSRVVSMRKRLPFHNNEVWMLLINNGMAGGYITNLLRALIFFE